MKFRANLDPNAGPHCFTNIEADIKKTQMVEGEIQEYIDKRLLRIEGVYRYELDDLKLKDLVKEGEQRQISARQVNVEEQIAQQAPAIEEVAEQESRLSKIRQLAIAVSASPVKIIVFTALSLILTVADICMDCLIKSMYVS